MITRISILLTLWFAWALNGYAQNDSLSASKLNLTVGISYNPFLALMEKKQELGPSFSIGYTLNKRFETGFSWFARQVIFSPDNSYKQLSNLNSAYNLESIYSGYIGIYLFQKKFSHMVSATVGVRHDLYKETLVNPQYDINQTFKNNEWNAMFGFGYTVRYNLSVKSAISLRLFMPLDRHPFDDVLRYSLEPGFVFKL